MKINYAIADCPLGLLLVGATEKGICSVTLGDDAEKLRHDLAAEFPQAEITRAEAELQSQVQTLVAHLQGQLPHPDLSLDVRGTAFQQRVWKALRTIPPGRTATYSDIAQRIGAPNATRAVAKACASNLLAVAIPCHRVVRRDGTLSGYRWGVERKRALLASEAHE